ncbi:MAG: biopolymer transporter ExbD [Pseudomonadota bacterium]
MRRLTKRKKTEPVISLINIVFLILIFFMVAGTLSQPSGGSIQFVETSGLDCCVEPDALIITSAGELIYRNETLSSASGYMQGGTSARLLPDRNLPATDLLRIVGELKALGAEDIVVLTETQL